jgi:site-specific recombinase XerD
MRTAGTGPDGLRLRGVVVVLWRAGLLINEALALTESDLDRERGAVSSVTVKAAAAARSEWIAGPGSSSTPG